MFSLRFIVHERIFVSVFAPIKLLLRNFQNCLEMETLKNDFNTVKIFHVLNTSKYMLMEVFYLHYFNPERVIC